MMWYMPWNWWEAVKVYIQRCHKCRRQFAHYHRPAYFCSTKCATDATTSGGPNS